MSDNPEKQSVDDISARLDQLINTVRSQEARVDALEKSVIRLQKVIVDDAASRFSVPTGFITQLQSGEPEHIEGNGVQVDPRSIQIATVKTYLRPKQPRVRLDKHGRWQINTPALIAMGVPGYVVLLYDPHYEAVGLCPISEPVKHAYELKKHGGIHQKEVNAQALCSHYGIPKKYEPRPAAIVNGVSVTRPDGALEKVDGVLVFHIKDGIEIGSVDYRFIEFTRRQCRGMHVTPRASILFNVARMRNGYRTVNHRITFNETAHSFLGYSKAVQYGYLEELNAVVVKPAEGGTINSYPVRPVHDSRSFQASATYFIKAFGIDTKLADSTQFVPRAVDGGGFILYIDEGKPPNLALGGTKPKAVREASAAGRRYEFESRRGFIEHATAEIRSVIKKGRQPSRNAVAKLMRIDYKTYLKHLDYWCVKHEDLCEQAKKNGENAP